MSVAIGDYLTCKEVAERLNVSRCRVHQFVAEKRLKGEIVAGTIFFHVKEVAKFEKSPRKNGRPRKSEKSRKRGLQNPRR
jgi:excisionase family DNA binding protein